MAQMQAKVSRRYKKPRIIVYYNEQETKYYGILEDDGQSDGAVQFDLSDATMKALRADLNAHSDIEVN